MRKNAVGFLVLSVIVFSAAIPHARGQIASTNIVQGNISVVGERDVFTFSQASNGRYYFDALSNIFALKWSLEGPTGPQVTARSFTGSDSFNSSAPVISLRPGFHRLTIESDNGTTNGYAFRFMDLASASLITPGTSVSNTLAPGNETDMYQFTAAAGDRLFFDRTFLSAGLSVYWRLIDPYGNEVFGGSFNDVNTITQRVAGTYTLLVEGNITQTGTGSYSFNVVPQGNTPPVAYSGTPLTIGQIYSGSLTNPSTNAYTFTLATDARLVFDNLTNTPGLQWFLEGPPGLIVNNRNFNSSDGTGAFAAPTLELPAGDYQLRVRRSSAGTDSYRFRLLDITTATPITPGTPVSATLTPPQEIDMYRFNASAGSRYYFDFSPTNGTVSTHWYLVDPFGGVVESANVTVDRPARNLTIPGTYTLLVEGYFGADSGQPVYGFNIVPVNDGAQTLTMGALTSGSITGPGQAQRYFFTLTDHTRLYFDSRTSNSDLRWSLAGPIGNLLNNRTFTTSDGPNGYGGLDLAAGDYTLTVTAVNDSTGAFQFRFNDLGTAPTMTLGTPITSTLNPANETDAYRFSAAAGQKVFLDYISSSGLPNGYWRWVDPYGTVLLAGYFNDFGPITLPASGIYTLLIEGYHSEPGSGAYTVNVVPVTDGVQALTVGDLVTGAIATPGQFQNYNFTLPTRAFLYFDSRTNHNTIRWSLDGPRGNVVNNRIFSSADSGNAVMDLPAGDYTLKVTASGDTTGGFQFRLMDLAQAPPLTPGVPVSSTLNPANETDMYRFSAAAETKVYFDYISSGSLPNARWRCVDPYGANVMSTFLGDAGPMVLQAGGIYTLMIEGYIAEPGSGSYSVNVVAVTDGIHELTLGSLVSDTVSVPGQAHTYHFSLSAPGAFYFDARTSAANLRWTLDGPSGRPVSNRGFNTSDASGLTEPILQLTPGEYFLTVNGSVDNTGAFSFRLFDVASATPLTPGNQASASLNPGNKTDAYRFTAAAGDRFFFDWVSQTGLPNLYWRLYDPYFNRIFQRLTDDAGTNRLLAAGTYTLLIEGGYTDTASGFYQFNVVPAGNVPVPPPSGTPLTIGVTISSNLATATTTNIYIFTLASDARLFFDVLGGDNCNWSLSGPSGTLVANRAFFSTDGSDQLDSSLHCPAGDYRLAITGAAGAYSFRLLDAATATPFTPGVIVNGSASPGRATTLYQFSATAGDRFYYDGRPRSGFAATVYAKIVGPFGDRLLSQAVENDQDVFSVPHTGTYILSVEGRYIETAATGNFSFLLLPVSDGTNSFAVGDTVTGTISTAGQRHFHSFTLASPTRLFFDSLSYHVFSWTLEGPQGVVVNARQFWNSDSVDGNSLLDLPAGDYLMTVDAGAATTGDYGFRLVDSSSAVAITPGTLVNGSLAPANTTTLYRFNAIAGQQFYYDGRPTSGFSTTPYIRMFSPLNDSVLFQSVSSDNDVFSVPQTGTYLLAVEARASDTSTNGNFSFLLQPVLDGTNAITIGATVNGAISVAGQRQFYVFSLATATRLFFDSFSNHAFTWTLSGPAGVIVSARQFWSSDGTDGNSLLDLPAGDYVILVDTSAATTGNFSFRLLDGATASPFTPGTLVTGSLAPGTSTALYRFEASAGDAFYYDGRPTSGFTTAPYVQIFSPLGNTLMNSQTITSDKDTFTVPQTGSYIFAVEGRVSDTSASGNYSFLLARNPSQPPTPLFDTNVAPDLMVVGLAVNPSSGLHSGDSATVQWTTRNDGTATTIGSFTERVTVRNTGTSQVIVNRTLLYDEAISGAINPGETRPRQLVITLPNGPSGAGNLEVTVTSDTFNQVAEQNGGGTAEANNASSININSTLAPYPDLQVVGLSVSPPSGWPTGSVVTVSWVTTNTGTRATSGSWMENLIVRNTNTAQIILNTGTNYDASAAGDIPANGSRNRSLSFTMPVNASAYGAFEIVVTTDNDNNLFEYNGGGTAENNNSASLMSTSAPDLQIAGLTVTGNPSLQAGAQLVIQWNTANQGNVQADGAFYDRVTVRNTNTAELLFTSDLPYNPASGGNGPIPAGGSRARQQTFQLPDGARAVGRIEVSVTADIYGNLAELNEGNNSSQAQVTVAPRPYPDLVVTNVTGPASGRPGQSVPAIWTVRNVGTVPATASWSDHLFLSSDAAIGSDQYLTSLSFSGTLNAGQSITRTQQVTLPNFGTGNRYFVIETDAGNQVFEDNDGNNAAIAAQPTVLPATLILALSPNSVLESAGNHASLATLTRNSDVASALNVTLLNDQPSKVVVPPGITIPIGSPSTNFFVEVLNDAIADSNIVATIIAQAAAHVSVTNTLTVTEDDTPALTLRLSAASVSESAFSGAVTGTIRRNANTNVALTVNLTSDTPGALTVPPNVIIPAGETNVTFNLSPVGDDFVTGDRVVRILAAASGFSSVSAPITVLDDDTVSLSLQLSDNSVPENAVSPAATAVVTRSPVNSGSMRIRIQAANGSILQLPAEVTIPGNQSAVTFNVNVLDDNLAFGSHATTINVDAVAQDGSPIPGAHASAPFLVVDNDGPTLSVSINAAVIAEGSSTSATVTRNTPATNPLTVNLSAAPSGQISLPSSVVIPNGAASAPFTINGLADGTSDGAQEVDVTASSTGFNPGSAPVTVTDIDIPDLVVLSVSGPTNALTDGLVSAVWSVTNSGLAVATGTWVDEVYVSTDAQGANATLVAFVTNTGPLVVGDTYTHSRSFLLPSDPGTYWILVRVDARNNVTEGSERNNALLSTAIDVQPSYRATVSTTIDSAISGTPIPLSGQTFFSATGLPAPFRTATVRINVNRVRRTLQVLSDSQGNFTTVFHSIPGEAGVYTVGADHPHVRQDPVQDQFTLLGMRAAPWQLNIRLAPNVATNGEIEIQNLSPLPLTGLIADQEGLPLDFAATTTVTNVLAGSGTALLQFSISTTLNTPVSGRFFLRVTSGEGAILRIPVNFVVAPPTAQLVANPTLLDRGMLRGVQTLVTFDVINQGGVGSGDLTVALPVVPWLSLVSTSPIPSLAPGARSTVVLALNPATNLALGRYDGSIAIIGQQTSLGVPFQFRALSDARGDLLLTITDEHTYYVNGSPHPTNATVVLRDIVTNGIVAQATTDANGQIHFSNLLEGDYLLEALAPGHSSVRGGVRVVPGITTAQEVFMTLQTVRYEWHVVPTEIEDHYRVVIEPKFETEVPQPSLIVENPLIMPLVISGQTTQFEIRLRNNGLIALERVRVPVPSHPSLIITPLVTELEVLPAQTSVDIPVTIREAPPSGGGIMSAGAPCDNCVVQMPITAGFPCGGIFVSMTAPTMIAPVCLANTGCQFDRVDVTRVNFMTVNSISDRATFDCLMGNMNECQKARVRGYIGSGQFGSLLSPQLGFGLSGFCACGPPASIPNLFSAATALLIAPGFSVAPALAPAPPGAIFVTPLVPGFCTPPLSPGGGLASLSIPPSNGATGVCAKVRLELTQDVMLTRNAFRGTLVLENVGQGDLTGIQVTIDIRDGADQSANSLFGVREPTLAGLNAVDGSGVLGAGTSGSAEYLFIPTLDAAPTEPTVYLIGGTLRFIEDGREVVVPLLKAPITVLPEARLQLEYFQQRDVYSDDPFTPELEPAEPFALGLRINNVGAGIARNFRISSAQPRIIENQKGLVADFQLIGARIDNEPVTSTFNLNFGNINPDSSKIVVWDMTSTLQGKFIDYRASFEHVDDLGVRNLSLIESVNIHELIHVVRADRASDDTLPDFMVNDSPDPDSLPDILYLSQGSNAPVSIASSAAFTGSITPGNLQVQLTATMPAGWTYLRVTNPAPDFRLVSVRRSDSKQIRMGDNAWTTDRTFPSSQTGAIHETLLHLFDFNSTGNYTLTFAPIAQDTNAPSSAVATLPSTSPASFPVEWDGDDGTNGSGIAFFDIYVSVNGGPFTNWLAHTTLDSAIFAGQNGNTYAFYSRATDADGNPEIAPASADTQTTTSGANTAPTINPIANTTINEGSAFNVLATAIDTDTPRQTLTFSLIGAPVGTTIDGASGQIRWQTSEAHGGTTNIFTLVVADNGLPSLSSTQAFSVIVREVNSQPFFVNPVPDVQVDEETTFNYTVQASDSDIPPSQLTWQLAIGAPLGMSINPNNGAFSWLPTESHGPGEYPIMVTVRDNGSPQMSATRSLRVIVREVNRAPTLDPIPNQVTLVETTLTVPTSASDPDRPAQQFFFSLAPGAPRGARIDSATGVFTWTPSRSFAMTTNRVTVRVTDNGVPSLTGEQTFFIIVGDLLEARLGNGIVLSGGSNNIPITIFTTTPATNVVFDFEMLVNRLANFSLDPPAAPLGSATLQSLGGNRYRIQLGTAPGQHLAGEQIVSHLRFTALTGLPSTFVPLQVLTVSAQQTDGQPVPRALGDDGRVVYLGDEPLLEIFRAQTHLDLTLYGRPAPSYTIESTPILPPINWAPYWQGPVSNLFELFSVPPTNQMKYFRARRP